MQWSVPGDALVPDSHYPDKRFSCFPRGARTPFPPRLLARIFFCLGLARVILYFNNSICLLQDRKIIRRKKWVGNQSALTEPMQINPCDLELLLSLLAHSAKPDKAKKEKTFVCLRGTCCQHTKESLESHNLHFRGNCHHSLVEAAHQYSLQDLCGLPSHALGSLCCLVVKKLPRPSGCFGGGRLGTRSAARSQALPDHTSWLRKAAETSLQWLLEFT